MDWRRIIRTDIAASAVVHLTLVALIVLISEVHPFQAPPSDAVAVDIVTPEELKEKVPEPTPSPQLSLPELAAKDKAEAPAPPPPPPAQEPSPQPTPQASPGPQPSRTPAKREAAAQPQAQQQPQPAPQAPGYKQPEPDVTLKYGVMLGLPPELPPLPKDAPKENDSGGATTTEAAKLPANVIAEFRRHLRACAKLPDAVAPSDNVHIRMRAFMTTDGQLATVPALIEASASPAKGLALMQAAKAALQACQPYTMLPVDKYEEWKVLDLTFTPRDFGAP